MAKSTIASCGFCGRPRNEVRALIGNDGGPYICNRCLEDGHKAYQGAQIRPETQGGSKEDVLRKPREIKALLDEHVIAQEKAKTDLSIAVYNHYKRREAAKRGMDFGGVSPQKSNILLIGPSGVGKTELARTIARMLRVPFFVGDATRLTQAGYVGDDVESLIQGLIQDADGDLERAQWGIIFIDEFDKLARKSGRGATGYRDVNGEGVQQAILKLLEGSSMVVPRGMGMRSGMSGQGDTFDTSNVLFICAGSFAGIEEVVDRRVNRKASLGFGCPERQKVSPADIYLQVTEDDILDFGLIPELMGRLPVLTTVVDLTEEEMVRILTEPKNAIVKQFQALFQMDGIDLQFDGEALLAIGREAKRRPTGARALRSIVEMVLRPYSFDAPSDPTLRAIRVTEDAVTGKGQAILVREEAAK
jgi:ATP-dependent Clp protease ATP-binding subunit ClpX